MRALHKQLQIAEKVKSRVEEELKETTQTLAQLKVSHLSLHSSENKHWHNSNLVIYLYTAVKTNTGIAQC